MECSLKTLSGDILTSKDLKLICVYTYEVLVHVYMLIETRSNVLTVKSVDLGIRHSIPSFIYINTMSCIVLTDHQSASQKTALVCALNLVLVISFAWYVSSGKDSLRVRDRFHFCCVFLPLQQSPKSFELLITFALSYS